MARDCQAAIQLAKGLDPSPCVCLEIRSALPSSHQDSGDVRFQRNTENGSEQSYARRPCLDGRLDQNACLASGPKCLAFIWLPT